MFQSIMCVGAVPMGQMPTDCTVPENLIQVSAIFSLLESPREGIFGTHDAVPVLQ